MLLHLNSHPPLFTAHSLMSEREAFKNSNNKLIVIGHTFEAIGVRSVATATFMFCVSDA